MINNTSKLNNISPETPTQMGRDWNCFHLQKNPPLGRVFILKLHRT